MLGSHICKLRPEPEKRERKTPLTVEPMAALPSLRCSSLITVSGYQACLCCLPLPGPARGAQTSVDPSA